MSKQLLNKAFHLFRKNGLFAKQNFWCCQSCAVSAIELSGDQKGYVFYHNQDNDDLNERGEVLLSYGGENDLEIGKLVVRLLIDVGLEVEWDGKETTRILVNVDLPRKPSHKIEGSVDFYSGTPDLLELDIELVEFVKILHAKGYRTIASCAGHAEEISKSGYTGGYMWFETPISAKPPISTWFDDMSLRWHAKTEKRLLNIHKALVKWANTLPSVKPAPLKHRFGDAIKSANQ